MAPQRSTSTSTGTGTGSDGTVRSAPRGLLVAVGLAAVLALAGCGTSGGESASDDDRVTTTVATTTEADETTTTAADDEPTTTEPDEDETTTTVEVDDDDITDGLVDGLVERVRAGLEASPLDPEQTDCVIEVFEQGARGELDDAGLDAGYAACGATTGQVAIAAVHGALLEGGVPDDAAQCMADELAAVDEDELEGLFDDEAAIEALAIECGVPQDLLE